jgi:hypothetical protein
MAKKEIEFCNHIKADGNLCESPALRDQEYCFFHKATRERVKRQRRAARLKQAFQLPVLEDAAAIQLAIGDTLNALLAGQIDHKTAGSVLYGLQTAAANARHVSFEICEGARRFTSYDTEEQDSLEEEIQQEIEAEQKEENDTRLREAQTGDLPVPLPSITANREVGDSGCPQKNLRSSSLNRLRPRRHERKKLEEALKPGSRLRLNGCALAGQQLRKLYQGR